MKPAAAFLFFVLFLAGIALVNLRSMRPPADTPVMTADELIGPSWRGTYLGEMPMDADSPVFIRFSDANQVAGNAGCNRFSGSWDLAEGRLSIAMLAVTRMACPEPANSLEIAFLTQLDTVRSASRAGDRLVLQNGSAQAVLQFATDARAAE